MTAITANLANSENWVQFISQTVSSPSLDENGRPRVPIGTIPFNAPLGKPIFAVRTDTSARPANPAWKWGGLFDILVITGLGSGNQGDTVITQKPLKLNQFNLIVAPDIGTAYSCQVTSPNWFPNIFFEVYQYIGPGAVSEYDLGVAIYNEVRLIN